MFQHVQPFRSDPQAVPSAEGTQLPPRVDVVETTEEIIYIFEVPGIDTQDINVEIGGGNLFIDGKIDTGLPSKELSYLYQERFYCKGYSRLLSVPAQVDADKVLADVKNGLLMVRFPKKNKGKRFKVKTQDQQ